MGGGDPAKPNRHTRVTCDGGEHAKLGLFARVREYIMSVSVVNLCRSLELGRADLVLSRTARIVEKYIIVIVVVVVVFIV